MPAGLGGLSSQVLMAYRSPGFQPAANSGALTLLNSTIRSVHLLGFTDFSMGPANSVRQENGPERTARNYQTYFDIERRLT